MNTTLSTFNENLPAYTALGGNVRRNQSGLTAVVLNRKGHAGRFGFFQDLEKAGFDYIISVEGKEKRFDIDEISAAFPFVRFLLLQDDLNPGAQINLAAAETASPLFMVLWSDTRLLIGQAERIARRFKEDDSASRLCTVPVIQDSRFEILPTLSAPVLLKKEITAAFSAPAADEAPSLFPFDAAGVYDRERFIAFEGFDGGIDSIYWQLMDFGFRALLWGEEIRSTQLVKLSYDGSITAADATKGAGYRRFWLKNIAPVFRGDYANLPLKKFLPFLFRSDADFLGAWEEFFLARRWVAGRRFRFRRDARSLENSRQAE